MDINEGIFKRRSQTMKPSFYKIADKHPEFTFVEVDIDNLSEAAEMAEVMEIPTIVVYMESYEGQES